jgi:hypothetical protein
MRSKRPGFSLALACVFAMVSVLGCNNEPARSGQPPPAVDDTQYSGAQRQAPDYDYQARPAPKPEQRSGMSKTAKTAVVLAGAAALYYLYKRHKNAQQATGVDGQYYLSKNGRVYYRDADHRAHWVTPPRGGISVPADEAAEFEDFQGYDNRTTGRDLTGLGDSAY